MIPITPTHYHKNEIFQPKFQQINPQCSMTDNSSQKQPSRGFLKERYSENMQQIYRRTPMKKCNFNKVALQLY